MTIRSLSILFSGTLLTLTLAACGGTDASPPSGEPAATSVSTSSPASEAPAYDIPEGAIVVRPDGDQLAFADTEFTVKAGEEVTLVFQNTATAAAMSHNVLVLTSADAINRVGQSAMAAGPAKEYIPDDEAVLAGTPVAAPGETVQVTFTAPSTPGEYPYICTFGGHYMMMQGTMMVTN